MSLTKLEIQQRVLEGQVFALEAGKEGGYLSAEFIHRESSRLLALALGVSDDLTARLQCLRGSTSVS